MNIKEKTSTISINSKYTTSWFVLLSLKFKIRMYLIHAAVTTNFDRHIRSSHLGFPKKLGELEQNWIFQKIVRPLCPEITRSELQIKIAAFKADSAYRSNLSSVSVKCQNNQFNDLELLVKFAPDQGSIRDHSVFVLQQNSKKEVNFYNYCAGNLIDICPPHYYAKKHTRSGHMCLVLKHLDYDHFAETDPISVNHAQRAIEALATLHAHYWGLKVPGSDQFKNISPTVIDYFCSRFSGKRAKILQKVMRLCWLQGIEQPQTLVHGDARIGNMLFDRSSDNTVLIDWQAVRPHKCAWDIVYFMMFSLPPKMRAEHYDDLVNYYMNCLSSFGIKTYSKACFEEDAAHCTFLLAAFSMVPMLLCEASVSKTDSRQFLDQILLPWRDRSIAYMNDSDFGWLAHKIGESEQNVRQAFLEEQHKGIYMQMIRRFEKQANR